MDLKTKALVDVILAAVKEYVKQARAAHIAEVETRLSAVPAGKSAYQLAFESGAFKGNEAQWLESLHGRNAEPVSAEALQAAVKSVVGPEVAEMQKAAADSLLLIEERSNASLQQMLTEHLPKAVEQAVSSAVASAVAALPPPLPGKDADPVDYEKLKQEMAKLVVQEFRSTGFENFVSLAVKEAVDKLPPAAPGKDADPIDYEKVSAEIVERVKYVVDALPLLDIIEPLVKSEVSKIPPAAPGKDADPIDYEKVYAEISARVKSAVDSIPLNDVVELTVKNQIAKLPPAAPGKDADPVDYEKLAALVCEFTKRFVTEQIAERVAALPPAPKGDKGDSVDEEKLVERLVAELWKQIKPYIEDEERSDREAMSAEYEAAKKVLAQSVDERVSAKVDEVVSAKVAEAVAALPPAPPGKDADPIHPDTVRLMVAEAVKQALAEVPRARDGDPGRDALALDPLPEINPDKSYPRGTYAEHRCGIVRAIRSTDPLSAQLGLEKSGWLVCMNGIFSESEESLEEGRVLRRVTEYTNGKRFERDLRTSIILNRGIWQQERDYEPGDVVTLSGSSWHCKKENRGERPGRPESSASWVLMVKQGAKGEDLRPPKDPGPTPTPVVKVGP